MLIIDAHLDLSYNAIRGRPVLLPAAEQAPDSEGIPTVGLPDLRAGGVGLVCATIFCEPLPDGSTAPIPAGYRTPQEAHDAALEQLRWYQRQEAAGEFHFVTGPAGLPGDDGAPPSSRAVRAILLLEGGDPLRTPDDVADWFAAGLRLVGLAWKRTRHAGGTGAPGPLTAEGVEMVKELDRFGIIHDASHLAEESFWQLLDQSDGPVIASHSNCRALIPTDRQLSDEMIGAIVQRGGVIGINLFDKFLVPPEEYGKRRATLADVVRHVRHICDLAGNAAHVGIGTDMDGGLGREQIPVEIATSADLHRIADALVEAGFSEPDTAGVMGQNWLRFFRERLAPAR